jgi:phage tail-like protein
MIEVGDAVTTGWGDEPGGGDLVVSRSTGVVPVGPAQVSHVVDFYRRYPGDPVTFYTLVEIFETQQDLTLRVSIPRGLELGDYGPPPALRGKVPYVEIDEEARYLVWSLDGQLAAGTRYEFHAEARVEASRIWRQFTSRAVLTTTSHEQLSDEYVTIGIQPKGNYLRYLPELYDQDELMGRFLMLFESFWKPIDTQIGSIHHYFDPRLTPAGFLPWLASWLDLEIDQSWPEPKIRQLVRWAIALHRSRGTRWGLLKYLEIYTGERAVINEGRSKNFVLGQSAQLGPGIALGTGNLPHTFTVNLTLPPVDTNDEKERQRLERVRRQTIERIIAIQKPAHTVFTLNLNIVSPEELAAQVAAETAAQAETRKPKPDDEISAQSEIWFKLPD